MKVLFILCAVVLASNAKFISYEIVQAVEGEGRPELEAVEPRVAELEEPQVDENSALKYEGQHPVPLDLEEQAVSGLALPMMGRACTSWDCIYVCRLLGFSGGWCISTTTCRCY